MVQCMLCGRLVTGPLQGYVVGWGPVVYKCLDCSIPAGAHPVSERYVHARFAPGVWVMIDPSIRRLHPCSPLAGGVVQVCEGSYYPLLERMGGRSHESLVPVQDDAGNVWFVEEEYVQAW